MVRWCGHLPTRCFMSFISARIQIESYLDSRGDKTQISIHSFGDANFSHSLFDVIYLPANPDRILSGFAGRLISHYWKQTISSCDQTHWTQVVEVLPLTKPNQHQNGTPSTHLLGLSPNRNTSVLFILSAICKMNFMMIEKLMQLHHQGDLCLRHDIIMTSFYS